MEKLFSAGYWFETLPGDLNMPFWRAMFVVAGLCALLGVFSAIQMRRLSKDRLRRRLWVKLAAFSFTVAPMIVLLWFFRFQHAYVLSMRVWIAGWLAFSFVWLAFIVRFAVWVLPKRLKLREDREALRKYLPHK